MKPTDIFELRRENLERLALDRFKGNRAALSRAAEVHPNHINLILSENDEHRRNLGEVLARKIEQQLGLPARWLDNSHGGLSASVAPTTIDAPPMHSSMAGALRSCEVAAGLSLLPVQFEGLLKKITAPENLVLASIDTNDMAPELMDGDAVVVDTAVAAITVDGVYILSRAGKSPMLRRVGKTATGETTLAHGGNTPEEVSAATLKSLQVTGRVVCSLRLQRV